MEYTCSPCPVAEIICRTTELVLFISGASISDDDVTIIDAIPTELVPFCPSCGAKGSLRDHVIRRLVDIPVAGHPARLRVRVRVRVPRFRCVHDACSQAIFQQQLDAAAAGAKTTYRALRI